MRSERAISLQKLADMLEAIEEIHAFTRGTSEEDFRNDRMRYRAVERCLEILAEAQKGVAADVRARHADIPWVGLQVLGNRYRHQYFRVSSDLVWEAATGPDLARIETMIHEELALADADQDMKE
jgi:uncharacterized protein with HEPN domain